MPMKQFEFHNIGFKYKYEKVFLAIEELHNMNGFEVNGYYIFRNSKNDEFTDVISFKENSINSYEKESEMQIKKNKIIKVVLAKFEEKYRDNFDREINIPIINSYDELNMFSPYGFKNSTYDKITDKVKSWELKERFRKMRDSSNESKSGKLRGL